MIDLDKLRADVAGFAGRFEAVDDSLVYLSDNHEPYEISESLDQHVAEPIARMLNSVGPLLDALAEIKKALGEACDMAESDVDGTCSKECRLSCIAAGHCARLAAWRQLSELRAVGRAK